MRDPVVSLRLPTHAIRDLDWLRGEMCRETGEPYTLSEILRQVIERGMAPNPYVEEQQDAEEMDLPGMRAGEGGEERAEEEGPQAEAKGQRE